jgi:uncharacterized protein YoxC
MTDENQAANRDAVDSEIFEDWLDQAAESKGVSKQELMDRMLSSYWILDELTDLVDGSTSGDDPDEQSVSAALPTSEVDPESRDDSQDSLIDETATQRERGVSQEDIQAVLWEMLEGHPALDDRSSDESSNDSTGAADDETSDTLSELERQVETFETELETLETRQDRQFDRLSDEIQLVLDRIGALEQKQDQLAPADDIDLLADKVRELSADVAELRTSDEELESRMDREFDSIEELFRRVLDALDGLEDDIDAATESYRSELEPIRQREDEQRRLEELKTDALKRGIRKGSCEKCGQTVDLALLESPECPSCAARFTGLGRSTWNPFQSPTLETERAPIDDP